MKYHLKRFSGQSTMSAYSRGLIRSLIDGCHKMLSDGSIEGIAAKKLAALLAPIDAENAAKTAALNSAIASLPSEVPYSPPDMPVVFEGRTFCLSGNFAIGSKELAAAIIGNLGGIPTDTLRSSDDYLVVGSIPDSAWAHGNYGTKVARVITKWNHIPIISEEHLMLAIDAAPL